MSNILLLTFNRSKMFEALLESIPAGAGSLYVSCDGSREGNVNDTHQISIIKEIVEKYTKNPIKTQFLDNNHGCKNGVIAGINWFFDNVPEGIILEDDIQYTPEFFAFADYSLNEFRADQRIGMICGTSLLPANSEYFIEPFCAQFPSVWGWATWANRWSDYDAECSDLEEFRSVYLNIYLKYGFGKKSFGLILAAAHGQIDTWDYQLTHMLIKTGRFALFPPTNLVSNVGFDKDATHTINSRSLMSKLSKASGRDVDVPFHPSYKYQGKYIQHLQKISFFARLGRLGRLFYAFSNK